MSNLKRAGKKSFVEAYALVESLDTILPQLEDLLDEVRYRDFQAMLDNPEMSPLTIYNKGFTALSRLREELAQNVSHNKKLK